MSLKACLPIKKHYLEMGKKGTLRQGKRYDENKYHFFVFLTSLNLFEQKWNGSVTPT